MSNKFTELTIDEFYQKEMFNEINVIIHNGIYYYDVSNFRKSSWTQLDQIVEEVKKCDILCSNCHKILTQKEINNAS